MKSRSQAKTVAKSVPENAEEWQVLLTDIAARRQQRLIELEENTARRRDLACAAAGGQDEAMKTAAVLAERSASVQHELTLLQFAEEQAQTEIAKHNQEAAAKSRLVAIEEQGKRLENRSQLAATIEGHLRNLANDLGALDRLGEEISRSYYMLGGDRLIVAPLARGAVGSRLSEFCFGLGLEQWLPVTCSATKVPPTSFCHIESDAQAAYEIQQ